MNTGLAFVPVFPIDFVFAATGAILLFIGAWGTIYYRNAFNPLLFFAINDGLFQTLLSAWIARTILFVPEKDVSATLVLACIYILGLALPFIPLRLPRFRQARLKLVLRSSALSSALFSRKRRYHLFFLALGFAVAFIALMVQSRAGFLWITDPRSAYQNNRAGSGFLFLLVQWILVSGLIIYLFGRPQTVRSSIMSLVVYLPASYFSGSKASLVCGIVLWTAFYNFRVKKIPIIIFCIFVGLFLPLFFALLFLQGSYSDVSEALEYFKDYVVTTANFIGRFNEFGLHYGSAYISDFWFYVPRALYPGKPFEYGLTLIHQILYPGMAELGHTPGILGWSLSYLDFGTIGVFVSGIGSGLVKRFAYEYFLAHRESIFAFVILMQLSLFPIFIYANLPLSIVIAFAVHAFASLRVIRSLS